MKKGCIGPKEGEGVKSERPMPSRIFGLNRPVLLNSTGVNSGATWKTAGRRKWHAPHYVEKNRQICTHAALNKYINIGRCACGGLQIWLFTIKQKCKRKSTLGGVDEGGERWRRMLRRVHRRRPGNQCGGLVIWKPFLFSFHWLLQMREGLVNLMLFSCWSQRFLSLWETAPLRAPLSSAA